MGAIVAHRDAPRLDRRVPHRRRHDRPGGGRARARAASRVLPPAAGEPAQAAGALSAEIQATLFEGDLDESTWERLEEALIMADVGARTTAEVVSKLETEAESGAV